MMQTWDGHAAYSLEGHTHPLIILFVRLFVGLLLVVLTLPDDNYFLRRASNLLEGGHS